MGWFNDEVNLPEIAMFFQVLVKENDFFYSFNECVEKPFLQTNIFKFGRLEKEVKRTTLTI